MAAPIARGLNGCPARQVPVLWEKPCLSRGRDNLSARSYGQGGILQRRPVDKPFNLINFPPPSTAATKLVNFFLV